MLALVTISFCMRLDIPAAFHKLARPANRAVGDWDGPFALRTEIIHRFDDAKAKVRLPITIDCDAGSERIAAIDKPFCEA